jgi:hypothetical protein
VTWRDTTHFPDNPIYPQRLDTMAKKAGGYDPRFLQAPLLFDNTNGAFPDLPEDVLVIGNGNHRRALAEREGKLDDDFIAVIHRGLTAVEVHEIRGGVNAQRTVKPAEQFLNEAAQGNRENLAIIAAVEGLGWSVTYERAEGGLSCTNELRWIWREDKGAMVRAIRSYEDIWGRKDASTQATVIKGLGAFWAKYADADAKRLASRTRRQGYTVKELYEAGKEQNTKHLRRVLRGNWDGVRYVLAATYNVGLGGNPDKVLPIP